MMMLTVVHGLVQMVMSQLMNNANFNNMHIEMRGIRASATATGTPHHAPSSRQ